MQTSSLARHFGEQNYILYIVYIARFQRKEEKLQAKTIKIGKIAFEKSTTVRLSMFATTRTLVSCNVELTKFLSL